MKPTFTAGILWILLMSCPGSLSSQTAPYSSGVQPRVTVEFENEVQTLANGFEKAFKELPSGGKYIEVSTSEGPAFPKGSVRSVKALEGVLLIRMAHGLRHVISARDILRMTTDKPDSGNKQGHTSLKGKS